MSKKEKSAGRPTKKDPEVVTKLISAFSKGFTIKEACAYSGIARETFYRWIKEDLEFYDNIQQAKAKLNIRAKEVLVEAVENGDLTSARWWLSRYEKDEDSDNSLGFESKLLREVVQTREKIIAYRYRKMLFVEREKLLKEKDVKKVSYFVKRLDSLLKLSDSKIADYAELELSSLATDKAGVRDEILERNEFRSYIKDEANIIERYNY